MLDHGWMKPRCVWCVQFQPLVRIIDFQAAHASQFILRPHVRGPTLAPANHLLFVFSLLSQQCNAFSRKEGALHFQWNLRITPHSEQLSFKAFVFTKSTLLFRYKKITTMPWKGKIPHTIPLILFCYHAEVSTAQLKIKYLNTSFVLSYLFLILLNLY